MKKIMILGASYTQIPLYNAAKQMGLKTVAASIDGPYPCFDIADEKIYVNIADPKACAEAALACHADAVATCGLDLGMRSIGYINDACHLTGPSKEAARNVSDKYLMKLALTGAGVCTAPFFCIRTEDDLEAAMEKLTFPVILKAVDLMGSRGIFKSETKEEARINFRRSMEATGKTYCLIEQFIEGPLFGVEAMIQNGEFVFMMPDNTEIFKAETNIPVGHSIPLDDYDRRFPEIEKQVKAAVKAVGLDNCPVNVDCIQHGDEVYIVELTGRSGATGLSEIVSLKYDINYYEEIIKIALGEDVRPDFAGEPFSGGILTNTLTSKREGIVRKITSFNAPDDEIKDLSFNIVPGDKVQPFTNGRDRIGQVILKCASLDRCKEKLAEINSKILIELDNDIDVTKTPVLKLYDDESGNHIFMKREDLLPYSYGGNKVRFACEYLKDMKAKGCGAMIIYGGYSSNLCRILSAVCRDFGIPCAMIYNTEDSDPEKDSLNASLIRECNVKEFRCTKSGIADAVQSAFDHFTDQGLKPYYIHGDKFGRGNVHTPMKSYYDVYFEILEQEKELGVKFDYIFLAGSTNTSQAGLAAAQLTCPEFRHIVGISVNRQEKRAREAMLSALEEYRSVNNIPEWKRDPSDEIEFCDSCLCGGYGLYDSDVEKCIKEMYEKFGIGLDPCYTGKAFSGMGKYLKEFGISGMNVLFIHTGGTPLFLDYQKKNRLYRHQDI